MLQHAVPEEHLRAIGDIVVWFQLLEVTVRHYVGALINDTQIRDVITAELNFRELRSLAMSLHLARFGQHAHFDELKEYMGKCGDIQDKRNRFIHSLYGAWDENAISLTKMTARGSKGLQFKSEPMTVPRL
jgi:hypothetical protein